MELRHLRYFAAVAEELHFGRAAVRLGIAQPPLSQQIRALERELGVELFRRTRRRVELTPPGLLLRDRARAILADAEQAAADVRRAARGEIGRLVIGLVSSATYEDVIPGLLRCFRERYPEVELVLEEASSARQIELVRKGDMQIGFVRGPLEEQGIALETVMREPLVLALPESHPMARDAAVPLRALAADRWVMLPRELGLGFHDFVMDLCRKAGFTPSVAQEATHIHTIIGLVAAGLGVTLVPAAVANLRRKGVVYRPLDPPGPEAEIAAAYIASAQSPILSAFLAVLREHCGVGA